MTASKGQTPPPKKRVLTGLKCASCAGSVDVQEGLTNVVCRYCGTPQAVVGRRGVISLMVLNTLEREDASEVVRRWFRRGIRKDPALKKEARSHRINRRNFEAVADRAVGGAPPPLDHNIVFTTVEAEVPDDQKVAAESELNNDIEFTLNLLFHR